jgi:protoporphyrinogen oxidase
MQVIIIGAGIAGLSTGIFLRQKGVDTTIIEKSETHGGLCRSFRLNTCTFDQGPHVFFGPKAVGLINELSGCDFSFHTLPSIFEKMFIKGRYFDFPFQLINFLKAMHKHRLLSVGLALSTNGLVISDRDNSNDVENWIIRRVGKPLYTYTDLGSYIQKLSGHPPHQISADWGKHKLKFLNSFNFFSLIRKMQNFSHTAGSRTINYPRASLGEVIDRFAENYIRRGGKIIYNCAIHNIENHNGIRVIGQTDKDNIEIAGDFLVSTIPITSFVGYLHGKCPTEVQEALQKISYRSLRLVALRINRSDVLPDGCVYFPQNQHLFKRVTEYNKICTSLTPSDESLLTAEVTCFAKDNLHSIPADTLLSKVSSQLEQCGYLTRSQIVDSKVINISHAYPVYKIGYEDALKKILSFLRTHDNMITIGRQGLFHYTNMSKSMVSARALAEEFTSIGPDRWRQFIGGVYDKRLNLYQHS